MKALENKYTKIERVVAKASFSYWGYFSEVLLAIILGGIVAVIWVFNLKIEQLFIKDAETVSYLTDENMRWALLAVGILVLLCVFCRTVHIWSKELILTEDKVVYRKGFIGVETAVIPLTAIKIVETKQNVFQRLVGCGTVTVISDAEKPYVIKGVNSPCDKQPGVTVSEQLKAFNTSVFYLSQVNQLQLISNTVKHIVIQGCVGREVMSFNLSDLDCLITLEMGCAAFLRCHKIVLTSMNDWIIDD